MTRKLLDHIEIKTSESPEYSVIWLHGLGASGHDFEPIVPELKLLQRPGVRFIFPHAPVRPITINGGAAMRAWYDITSSDFNSREQDATGIQESVTHITDIIDNEIKRGVRSEHIIVAGFSQGGAIALQTGLTSALQLGGVLALSTYLPMDSSSVGTINPAKKSMPIFMAHGLQDDVIPLRFAEQSRDTLQALGASLEWQTYAISHSVSAAEVSDIEAWLKRLFGM